jgi:hypothetical protein
MPGRPTAITRPFINPIDMKRSIILLACTTLFCGCGTPNRSAFTGARGEAELIVLHPADEQLAQVQSRMNPQINRTVHVFAPEGEGLQSYLARINAFNSRPDSATSWNEVVSNEGDFLARMLGEKPGNVALLSGRTATAAGYSAACIGAGLNVLSTAPLASGTPEFRELERSLGLADEKGLVLYELMPERYEIAALLQQALARNADFFGIQLCGSPEAPAIVSESVLPLFTVRMEGTGSSTALRPGITGPTANDKTANANGESRDNSAFETAPADYDDWSYPADSLGLQNAFLLAAAPRIDLIQLAVFGRERIKYNRQIQFTSARQYPAAVPEREYLRASGSAALPPALQPYRSGDTLRLPGNGVLRYVLNGVHTGVSIRHYLPGSGTAPAQHKSPATAATAPEDKAASHADAGTTAGMTVGTTGIPQALPAPYRKLALQGEKATLTLVERGGALPQLYIVPAPGTDSTRFAQSLLAALGQLAPLCPGLGIEPAGTAFRVVIPAEARTALPQRIEKAASQYLDYLVQGYPPFWEVDQMLAKYYTLIRPFDESQQQ